MQAQIRTALVLCLSWGCIEDARTLDPDDLDGGGSVDAALIDGAPLDAAAPDARPSSDVGGAPDAEPAMDAGPRADAAALPDAGPPEPDGGADCPAPVIDPSEVVAAPLDIVALDGQADGDIVEWRWTVVERPEGSTTQPVESFFNPARPADGGVLDDASTSTAQLFVDLPGRYVLELTVVDARGVESCAPARLVIDAFPLDGLTITLTWDTPADPNQSDGIGTDMDLTLRHENAGEAWLHPDWACHFRNPDPDWGDVPANNPSLLVDDTNGAGPEVVSLRRVQSVNYDVGVHYFRAESSFGDPDIDPRTAHESTARLRVFVNGALRSEVDRVLARGGQLWWPARITGCDDDDCPRIEARGDVFDRGEWVETP